MTEPASLDVMARLLPSLALIVGALLLLRRWSRRGVGSRAGSGLRVLHRTGLTRGAMLAVVAVGERHFLVGAGEHGVALLSELDAADLEAAAAQGLPGQPAVPLDGDTGLGQAERLPARATDRRAATGDRPWMGLVERLRAMTVRTHLERSIRAPRGAQLP